MSLETPTITLQAARRRAGLRPGVPSPCISVCRMDASTGLCEGCLRTLDEVASWAMASDEEKRAVWKMLVERAQGA